MSTTLANGWRAVFALVHFSDTVLQPHLRPLSSYVHLPGSWDYRHVLTHQAWVLFCGIGAPTQGLHLEPLLQSFFVKIFRVRVS
jgi:hypothetical protein